jgi:hypothetical protein
MLLYEEAQAMHSISSEMRGVLPLGLLRAAPQPEHAIANPSSTSSCTCRQTASRPRHRSQHTELPRPGSLAPRFVLI